MAKRSMNPTVKEMKALADRNFMVGREKAEIINTGLEQSGDHNHVVAVNGSRIGGAQAYSIFIRRTVKKMFKAGLEQEAYEMFLTDPTLMRNVGWKEFVGLMEA